MMTKIEKRKVLWLVGHKPYAEQVRELQTIFNAEVVVDTRHLNSVAEIVEKMKNVGADEVVVLLPDSWLCDLLKLGIQPVRPKMRRLFTRNRKPVFQHIGFVRVRRFELEVEKLES